MELKNIKQIFYPLRELDDYEVNLLKTEIHNMKESVVAYFHVWVNYFFVNKKVNEKKERRNKIRVLTS